MFSRGALCAKRNRGVTEMQDFLKMWCFEEKWFVVWACKELTFVYRVRFPSTTMTDLSGFYLV